MDISQDSQDLTRKTTVGWVCPTVQTQLYLAKTFMSFSSHGKLISRLRWRLRNLAAGFGDQRG